MRTAWCYLFITVICLMILSEDNKTFDMIRMMINKTILKMRKVWILSPHLYACTRPRIWALDNEKYAFCWRLHELFLLMCESIFRLSDYVFHTKYLFMVVLQITILRHGDYQLEHCSTCVNENIRFLLYLVYYLIIA